MRKFAILLVLLCAAVRSSTQAQPNGVTAQLELGQDQYLPDEDLRLRVHITNRSGQPLTLGADTNWITFDFIGEHDYVVPKLGDMPVVGPFTLQTGQEITREFNPTPYYGYRHPGHFRVGAIVKLAQWKQEIVCKPVMFTVSDGVALPNLGDLSVGLPPAPGATNAPPEVRRYSLLKVAYLDELKLYFRLTDQGGRTLRVFPLTRMVSFSDPRVQIDRANNLHVLLQTGARTFTYCVLDVNGNLLARQFHEFAQSRPSLNMSDDGRVFVAGGRRLPTRDDIPAPTADTAWGP